MRQLEVITERWAMVRPVRIAGYTLPDPETVLVTIGEGGHRGRGEAMGVFYYGETAATIAADVERVRGAIEAGAGREELRQLLEPGGARNALDCALWDLEAKLANKPVWVLAGMRPPEPLLTTYTLGGDTPHAMAHCARSAYRHARAIKIKLLGDDHDGLRVKAIRSARPDVWLGVDANQGWSRRQLDDMLPILIEERVSLIEQPCEIGMEAQLDGLKSPIALAADESVQSLDDIAGVIGRFGTINIKLDKCGGLTEALLMVEKARLHGLNVMVGNMGGTSLAMAPAMLLGQYCKVVDLDGPLFLRRDRAPSVTYDHGFVSAPRALWGWPA